MNPVTVYVVAECELLRSGLVTCLSRQDGIQVVGKAVSLERALDTKW